MNWIKKAGLDIAGIATNVVAPALQTAGHAVAVGAISVADAATLGHVDALGHARDEQLHHMHDAASNVEGGVCRTAVRPYFRGGAGDMGPWMKDIPDDRPVTSMFLPGTHDSSAMHGGDFAECQSWTIEEQLRAGIRCFDVRLKHRDDTLMCYHGIICQQREMPSVAEVFECFLEQHPSEVILARIKSEGQSEGQHSREFNEQVRCCWKDADRWVSPDGWGSLGSHRGKVLLFHCGMGNCYFDLQDKWEIGDHSEKLAEVLAHGQKDREPGVMYVSYTSSQGVDEFAYITPSGMAWHVNHGVFDNAHMLRPSVYMMDHPGQDLVTRLIQRNNVET